MSHRNNMVENIGLRGSHFNLGNNNPNSFVTMNSTTYNNQEKKKQMPNIKQQDTASAIEHDKANLRASHFTLGNQDPKNYYSTENSAQLRHYVDPTRAVLSEEQKKELRSHHFKLGQYAPTTQTMNNLTYDQKPLIEMKDQEKLKLFMRGHHHNFREMSNTIMTTKYNDDYNKEIDKQALQQGVTSEQMKEKALALRHSHIVLGKENPHFTSIQKQDYPQKENQYKPQSKDLQRTNFTLGSQKDPMCTTNDVFHDQQPIVTNPMAAETKAELRSSHFTMGQDQINYKSEFGSNYQKGAGDAQKQTISTAALQQNHFSLAQNQNKQTYQTSYSQNMKKPKLDDQLKQMRDQKQDRGSNFKIGNQGDSYTSEFSNSFKHQLGQPSQLNEEKKADLRSSHFNFNDIARNTYQTNYRTSFQTNQQNGRGQLNEEKLSDLRQNHFHFGNQKTNYGTTQQEFRHPGNPQPATLNQQQKADLRSHHFKLG